MNQFVVSARKYRPLRFDDVVGQEHVTSTLKKALMSDHLAHSFLFCGPRGVGKTSCARILAKAINCENAGADKEPCNECHSCKSFNELTSFNIIELDAASNNGVDHIRALSDQVRFKPQEGTYKVFIIDEVHMLSQAAFNAFLKTLEEPPPHAIFILATTEKHKILPTVLSRCQIYDFHRISIDAMTDHLTMIAEKENISAEEDALRLLATKADGALRDALSLFDRIGTVSEKGLTYQQVIEQLNILDYDYYFKFVEAFLEESIETVLTLYNEVVSKGFEGDQFLLGLGEHLRQLLVGKVPSTLSLMEGSEQLKKRYEEQSKKTDMGFLLTGLSLINDCDINYPRAKNKRLHVEICLSRICFMKRVVSGTAIAAETLQKKKPSATDDLKSEPAPTEKQPTQQQSSTEDLKEPTVKSEVTPEQPLPLPEKDSSVQGKPELLKAKLKVEAIVPSMPSIKDLTEEIEAVEKQKAEEEALILNLDHLMEDWRDYVASLTAQSLKKIFELSTLVLNKQNNIEIKVTSSIAKDAIIQDTSFIQKLRKKYDRPDLSISIELDEDRAREIREQNQRPVTFGEKYQHLTTVNPRLSTLQQRFELKEDNN
jgi:DNA polymerase-3 subunit gamma/tau